MDKIVHIQLPKWAPYLYGLIALVLVPWIFDLAANLPSRHLARHWDAVWVGFDVIMLITIAITVWFMLKRKVWVVVSATALATLFIVDVWFDILTAKPGREQTEAYIFGILEISLAILTYRLVFHVIHGSTPTKDIKLTTSK